MAAGIFGGAYVMITWLPTYLVQVRHMSLAQMGIYASLPWVALFVMVFVGGLIHSSYGWKGFIPGVLIGFGLACMIPYALLYAICGPGRMF